MKKINLPTAATALACLVSMATAYAEPADSVSSVEGRWRYDGNRRHGERIVVSAIRGVTSSMGLFARPIAADLLRRRNRFHEQLELRIRKDASGRAESVKLVLGKDRIVFDGEPERPQARSLDGAAMQILLRPDRGGWLLLATNDHAERRTRFTLQADGRLRVETQVTVDKLPRPLRYLHQYRRR